MKKVRRHGADVLEDARQAEERLALAERILDEVRRVGLGLPLRDVFVVVVDIGRQPAAPPVVVQGFQIQKLGFNGLSCRSLLRKSRHRHVRTLNTIPRANPIRSLQLRLKP